MSTPADSPDSPPTNPTAYDDEFSLLAPPSGNTLNPKWVWINQLGATATVGNGVLDMTASTTNGTWSLLVETVPPGPWTFVAKLRLQGNRGSYASGGICVLDSSTGHRANFGVFGKGNIIASDQGQSGGIEVQEWSSLTVSSADVYADHSGIPYNYVWFQVRNDGTNLIFSWSPDGLIYSPVRTETLVGFIANPDRIGFGMWSINASDPSPAVPTHLIVDYIRRTA